MINIMRLEVDSGGNQGWVLISQLILDASAVLAYLQSLAVDGNSYMAETATETGSLIIAQVP